MFLMINNGYSWRISLITSCYKIKYLNITIYHIYLDKIINISVSISLDQYHIIISVSILTITRLYIILDRKKNYLSESEKAKQ